MNYVQTINSLLKPSPRRSPWVLDLFAGCGDLALGFEMDADCCATHRAKLDPSYAFPRAQVVIGGSKNWARMMAAGHWRPVEFQGKVASRYQQIGNAVPPLMASAMAQSFRVCLAGRCARTHDSFQWKHISGAAPSPVSASPTRTQRRATTYF